MEYVRLLIRSVKACCVVLFGLLAMYGAAAAACIEAKGVDAPHRIYGQLVVAGFTGQARDDPGVIEAAGDLQQGYAGGLLFFARNIASSKQLQALTQFLKAGAAFPPLLAIDEEGGKVQRLLPRQGFGYQPSAAAVARESGEDALKSFRHTANEVAATGLNFNLGPVVDLNLQPSNPIIGLLGRAYGADPEVVTAYAGLFIAAHHEAGVLTSLKHFPGHGSSREDSHEAIVDVTADWKPVELEPYRKLIKAGVVDTIMLAHIINRAVWSTENLPATFSTDAVSMLRNDFGYDGIVMSDDLQMEAIAREHRLADAIVKALRAGVDLVVIGNVLDQQPQPARFAVDVIKRAVEEGGLDQSKLERSFCRVMKLKGRLRQR